MNDFNNYLNNILVDNLIQDDSQVKWVLEIIDDLFKSGSIQNGTGYCLAMSDLLQKLLYFNGIESELVECSLVIVDSNFTPPSLTMVGYENASLTKEDMMQNHVVLITKTKVPLIIDLSLFNRVKNVPYVIGVINENKSLELASLKINNAVFKYSRKPISTIPYLHQQSIVNRIKLDSTINSNFNQIKKLILIWFIMSGTNLIRGFYDFHQKYINTSNGFGPNKIQIQK